MSGLAGATARRLLGELEETRVRLGLEAMGALLAVLGDPHLRLPHVLVAGTNGKGSTAVQLHSILTASGYRTGLYTSPHLENVRERLRINGRAIGARELVERLQRVIALSTEHLGAPPTYFEALTAVAFDFFADETDIAVFEVGLGGRLDATNVGHPILSLISEIGIDHVEFLGRTEVEIAREKAGVMRRGRPVLATVTSAGRPELERQARVRGARWIDVLAESSVREVGDETIEVTTGAATYRLAASLLGEHQRRNVALAVRSAEVLAAEGWHRVTSSAIEAGVRGCVWPGRLERVALADGREVLLDAAHNAQGAATLAAYLAKHPERDCLLFGALEDKDVSAALPLLAAGAEWVVLTAPRSPRALAPGALLGLVDAARTRLEADVAAALDVALAGEARRIVVCGSIYLVGDVRRLLRRRFGRPIAAVDLDLAAGQSR